jgi:hypothetical protein
MAGMTTALTEYSDLGDKRTYFTSGHTVQKPKLVISTRRAPVGNQTVAQYELNVVHGTEDAEGNPLQSKVNIGVTARIPINGDSADVTAAQAILVDYVGSDEFTAALANLSHPA